MEIGPLELMIAATTLMELNPMFQAKKMFKTKSTDNVAWKTFAFVSIIGFIWLGYGIYLNNFPLIVGNGIKLLASLVVLFLYHRYSSNSTQVSEE